MKQRIILILLCLLSSSPGIAVTVTGTVYGPDNRPVDNAMVRIRDTEMHELARDYTSSNGIYRIEDIPKGTFTLEAIKSGYNKQKQEITLLGIDYDDEVVYDIHFMPFKRGSFLTKADLSNFYLPLDHKIPQRAMVAFTKGMKYYDRGKYEKSLKMFSKAIKKEPSFSRAYTQLGLSQMKLGDTQSAQKSFQKAAELNPRDPIPLLYLSEIALETKSYSSAAQYLQTALNCDPQLPKIYYLMGRLYYEQGNYQDAELALSKCLFKQFPESGQAHKLMGDICMKTHQLLKARDHYKTYLRKELAPPDKKDIQKKIQHIESELLKGKGLEANDGF